MTRHEIMELIRNIEQRIMEMEQHGDAYKDTIDADRETIQEMEDEMTLIKATAERTGGGHE